jgi:hypothetical protein
MRTIRRAAILKLATAAYEMDLDVFNGRLTQDDQGRWRINGRDIIAWLNDHANEDVVLVMGSLADERPVETRTCRTCGRDYTELECPHCRASRIRLRGRP